MMTFERMAALPVPTHTWLGFDGATSIDPIEPVANLPVARPASHVMPASSVFHTPPPTPPK